MKIAVTIVSIILAVVLFGTVLLPVIPTESENQLDVLIIAGQSNAEYSHEPMVDADILNEDYVEAPSHNLLYYGTASMPTYAWRGGDKALYPMYDGDSGKYRIGGYEPILGNEISKKTGHDVLIINTGVGARTVQELNPANRGTYGLYVKNVVEDALHLAKSQYDTIQPIGYIWLQGEADYTTPIQEYIEQFDQIGQFYHGYGFDTCYVVHTRNYYGGSANFAMTQILKTHKNVVMTTNISESFQIGDGTLDDDGPIHYSQHGRDLIAFELMDYIEIPSGSVENKLLRIIPLLLIATIVVAVAGFILRSKT